MRLTQVKATAVFQGENGNRETPSDSEFRRRLRDELRVKSRELRDLTQWQDSFANGNREKKNPEMHSLEGAQNEPLRDNEHKTAQM